MGQVCKGLESTFLSTWSSFREHSHWGAGKIPENLKGRAWDHIDDVLRQSWETVMVGTVQKMAPEEGH